MSWHDALPRLMLSEVIVVEPYPDKNCSDWARFLLTPTSLMAVWQLSWIKHVRLGNMQHILEPPILEHSVLRSARPDVAYTHLEGSSCQRTWCPDPHSTYKSIMEIFHWCPLVSNFVCIWFCCFSLLITGHNERKFSSNWPFVGLNQNSSFRGEKIIKRISQQASRDHFFPPEGC